jgi:hypothetical protein
VGQVINNLTKNSFNDGSKSVKECLRVPRRACLCGVCGVCNRNQPFN